MLGPGRGQGLGVVLGLEVGVGRALTPGILLVKDYNYDLWPRMGILAGTRNQIKD